MAEKQSNSNSKQVTTDDVCEFLRMRLIPVSIINKFRDNKIDGKVVNLMSDEELTNLGLNAIGDRISLRDKCRCNSAPNTRTERRKELLNALRTPPPNEDCLGSKSLPVRQRGKGRGRPHKSTRLVSFSLLVKKGPDVNNENKITTVKSPLGDKNYIQIPIPVDKEYDDVLDIVIESFFPNGRNPVIGDKSNYTMEIVNNLNLNVCHLVSPFTLSKYITSQKIPGTPKCNLLCHSLDEEDEDNGDDIINNSISINSHENIDNTINTETEDTYAVDCSEDSIALQHFFDELNSNVTGNEYDTSGIQVSTEDNLNISNSTDTSTQFVEQINSNVTGNEYDTSGIQVSTEDNLNISNSTDTSTQFVEQMNTSYISASSMELIAFMEPRIPSDAVKICINQTQNTDDPVEILRTYQRVFLKGTLLEQVSETEPLPERDMLAIFVSRLELFATGLAELIDTPASDLMKPLEVTFYGEEASDSGGPRKEFFTIMMRSFMDIENRLFIKTDNGYRLNQTTSALEKRFYYGAALVCGLSLIENGPIPTFMDDDELTIIIEGQNLSEAQQQFREGFEILGILHLISEKPTFRFLFRSAHIPLSVKKLVSILTVQFSPEGSNRRRFEENIYKMFLKYLKEVAAGRRGKLQLGDVLKFCTGSPEEPILGYTMKPMLVFVPEGKSALPTSSTCSNLIRLPVSSLSEKELFAAYDLAFCNDYFGIV